MKRKLLRMSRELGVSMANIVDLLRSNGFDYTEDPMEEIGDEAVDFINHNLAGYLSAKGPESFDRARKRDKEKPGQQQAAGEIPLELRIVDAASKEKMLTERIIGFTDFEWHYTVAKYDGVCSQPVKFDLFDEVLCDLLLIEPMSFKTIGSILGLDVEKDPAEREIMSLAIHGLKKDKMIEGDENSYSLTVEGRKYAADGVKFSTFNRQFELYFDGEGHVGGNARNIFSRLKSEKTHGPATVVSFDLEQIRLLAEHQAPEIHFPKNGFELQSAEFVKAEHLKAKVWVILLENFKDDTLRTLVYDEKQNLIIEELSKALNTKERVVDSLLNKIIVANEDIQLTEESKPAEQLEQEKLLINKQAEIEKAIEDKEYEKIEKVREEVLLIKKHFDSLEFEVELKRLFDETADELWVISPWIKWATLKRIPFFESYLQKGGRIFVAWSEPEAEGQVMAIPEPMDKLLDLERKYLNFYLYQLPPFHYKNVWLRNLQNTHLYYTGSYNILSFFVSQGPKKIRQEKMTRLNWDAEIQQQYLAVFNSFGLKYVNKTIEEFNALCDNAPAKIDRAFLQKVKTLDNAKLQPFINQGLTSFDLAYTELEKIKADKLHFFRMKFFEIAIENYRKQALELLPKPIASERKKKLQEEWEKLRDEFIDCMELQMKASAIKDLIDDIRIFNTQQKKR